MTVTRIHPLRKNGVRRYISAIPDKGIVVMVTGSSGCLGQHIVKLLQERGTYIKEIKTFDNKPSPQEVEFVERVPLTNILGDIRDLNSVQDAMKGVDVVFHTAAAISTGVFPNYKLMEEVNVDGTANVIEACIKENVSRLIYSSSNSVVQGLFQSIINGDESLPISKETAFPGYAETKYRAECLVAEAHGRPLAKGRGSTLRTLSLRVSTMYGEGDNHFLKEFLIATHSIGGRVCRFGNPNSRYQFSYAGNVAWTHLVAERALEKDPDVGGQAYFTGDDTPLKNHLDFAEPLFESRGMSLYKFVVPSLVTYWFIWLLEVVLILLGHWKQINVPMTSQLMRYLDNTYCFSTEKAVKKLGYKPLFSPEEALTNSMAYYNTFGLK